MSRDNCRGDYMAPPRIELGAPLRERGVLPLDYGALNILISGSYKISYICGENADAVNQPIIY